MPQSPDVIVDLPELTVTIRNFFQLEARAHAPASGCVFRLYRNRELIDSSRSADGSYGYHLETYGHYRIEVDCVEPASSSTASFRFNGFGAAPNTRLEPRITILGVSRLALVVHDLLLAAGRQDIVFASANSSHVGADFCGTTVRSVDDSELHTDEWLLVNGVTPDLERRIRRSGLPFGFVSSTDVTALEPYLRDLPLAAIHQVGRDYHLAGFKAGADFVARILRKRFGSVLPPSVDLSGARFAYGCIGTVINTKARIGQRVTIGQSVTIGGRHGIDPVIEDDVWIGAGAVILGCRIGHGTTIGANAVVTKDVPPGSVIVAPRNRDITRITEPQA